jgi:hypothetical protein
MMAGELVTMTQAEFGRALCKIKLRSDGLSESEIEASVSRFSDDFMDALAHSVKGLIGNVLDRF